MLIDQFHVKIDVDLIPGLYIIYEESGAGKTRLCSLLKKYREFGARVDGYTYYDFLHGYPLPLPVDVDLLMIDRYDMYNGKLTDQILEISKRAIVLIDCKTYLVGINTIYCCSLEMPASNLIEVF